MYEVSIFNILIENQSVLLLKKKKAIPLDIYTFIVCVIYIFIVCLKIFPNYQFTSSRKQGGGSY